MKLFIRKTLLMIFLVMAGIAAIVSFNYFIIGSQYEKSYSAAFYDKIERLRSIDGPKIILIGDSNVAFGMDSGRLEEAMGMPVVNLGLHGSLGSAFHQDMAKYNLNKGDIVISCSYSFSSADEIHDCTLAWTTIDNHADYLDILRTKDYPRMLSSYPRYLKKSSFLFITGSGNKDTGGCYSRNAFNQYGDIVVRPEEDRIDPREYFSAPENNLRKPTVDTPDIELINDFNRYVEDRGATLLIAGFPIAYGEYAGFSEEDIISYQEEIARRVDCDVISDFTDYLFPYEYFYNTNLHLTEEGTGVRTDLLISDLKRWKGAL